MNTKLNNRIEYAISIKHWCDAHPFSSDDELREFLEKIEKQIEKENSEKKLINLNYGGMNFGNPINCLEL